ncbi:hypothetical protein ACTXT7_004709 [Hymenolepis weldensis]
MYSNAGTASSNDSANSMPPNFPPSARDSRLIQAGHLGIKSNSNSSGSHSSGVRAFPPAPNPPLPLYQTPEHVFVPTGPMDRPVNHYEQRSSMGDNMTYSEVNSTSDMRDVNNEEDDCDGDTDFDESRIFSVYGQTSSMGFSHPVALNNNNNNQAGRVVATNSPDVTERLGEHREAHYNQDGKCNLVN